MDIVTALSGEGGTQTPMPFQYMILSHQNSRDTISIRPTINQVLRPQNNREKLFRSQGGREGGTVPELLFEKKKLIPELQRLLVQADNTS